VATIAAALAVRDYEFRKTQESPEGHVQCNPEYLDGSPDTVRHDLYLAGSLIVIPYDW